MTKVKKWGIILLIGVLTCTVLYAHTPKTITLKLGIFSGSNWNVPNADSYVIFDDLIARFEKTHPNVKVEYISGITRDEYSDWISKQAFKNQLPDVLMVLPEDFSTFAKVGLLKELTSIAQNDTNFNENVYYDASYDAGIYRDALYTLPYESVPTLMFMNKTLLEKEGVQIPENNWTWDDFYTICKKVSKDIDADGKLDQFGVYGYDWEHAIYANDVDLFSKDGEKTAIDSEKMIKAVTYVREIQNLNDNIYISSSDFDEGRIAFYPMQFSQYRAYKPYPWRVKKYSDFEWDCITLPKSMKGDNISKIETLSVGMSADTKYEALAWELMKMISMDKTTQMNIFHMSQGVSVLKDVTNSEEAMEILFRDNPGESDFKMDSLNEVMEKGKSQPNFTNYFDVVDQIDNDLYRVIHSTTNIENALVSLQKKIEKLLNR